jgi:hypothetical protein
LNVLGGRTKQIKFDIINSNGLEPHVNVELHVPTNLYPADSGMLRIENLHVYPQNNLEEQNLFVDQNNPKF